MYYRYTRTETPMSDWGHAMFAADKDSVDGCYGDVAWEYDGSQSVDINNLADLIASKWAEDSESGLVPDGYEMYAPDEISAEFNPQDIVMSAGAWDNGELTQWFWDRIADPMGISAIITSDGAIVFDEGLIKAA